MYQLKDASLDREAFTHKSYANEQGLTYDNQRLEFIGDAVMDLILSEELFKEKASTEGELTRLRASLVCEKSFAKAARDLGIEQCLKVGRGESMRDSILADAFEAYIGAIFLEAGYERTREFVLHEVYPHLDASAARDAKTLLQEMLQAKGIKDIKYKSLRETGPAHERTFEVALLISGQTVTTAQGKSKKEAQKNAASAYLDRL